MGSNCRAEERRGRGEGKASLILSPPRLTAIVCMTPGSRPIVTHHPLGEERGSSLTRFKEMELEMGSGEIWSSSSNSSRGVGEVHPSF